MNSKKRKLQFIRTKNNLRRGIVSFFYTQKISSKTSINPVMLKIVIKECRKDSLEQLLRLYKLDYRNYPYLKQTIEIAKINEDFIKGLQTMKCQVNLRGK